MYPFISLSLSLPLINSHISLCPYRYHVLQTFLFFSSHTNTHSHFLSLSFFLSVLYLHRISKAWMVGVESSLHFCITLAKARCLLCGCFLFVVLFLLIILFCLFENGVHGIAPAKCLEAACLSLGKEKGVWRCKMR